MYLGFPPPLLSLHLRGSSKLISCMNALRSSDIMEGRKRDDENRPSSIMAFSGGVLGGDCIPRDDDKIGSRW